MISGLPSGTNYLLVMNATESLKTASSGKKRAEQAFQAKMAANASAADKTAEAQKLRNTGKTIAATGQTIGAVAGVAAGVAGIVAAVAACCQAWPVAAVAAAIGVCCAAVGALFAAGGTLIGMAYEWQAAELEKEAAQDKLTAEHESQHVDDKKADAREARQMILQNLQWAVQADKKGKEEARSALQGA